MRIEIPGKPFAKQRPRMTRKGRTYTPGETVSFERTVGEYAMAEESVPFEGPIKISITAIFEPAKSWSKAKTAAAMWGPHTQKPDIDNIEKAILDGLNRIAFADDSQVCVMESRKMWGSPARTIVEVSGITTFEVGT